MNDLQDTRDLLRISEGRNVFDGPRTKVFNTHLSFPYIRK